MMIILSQAQFKTTCSNGCHIETQFYNTKIEYCNLHVISERNRYSSSFFKSGKRSIKNCIGFGNVLIYDIDNDTTNILSLTDAIQLTKDYKSMMVTTKSHQKIKNGIVVDRFRIIIPLDNPISISTKEYSNYYLHVASVLGIENFIDSACKDAARMYQPNLLQKVYYSKGKNILSEKQLRISFEEKQYLDLATKISSVSTFTFGSQYTCTNSKVDYIKSIMFSKKLLNLLDFENKFVEGNRNNYLYSIGRYLLDINLTVGEVKQTLLWINNLKNGLSETEITNTIFRSLKL